MDNAKKEEMKKNGRKRKEKQRETARDKDELEFKICRAKEKSNERKAAREMDESGFKKLRATEKSNERRAARKIDEPGIKKTMASEKANQRKAAREINEPGFKEARATEKSNERKAARKRNEPGFKKERALERAKSRIYEVNNQEKRRKKFIDSIKRGRIYECVCCHRKCFENGVSPLPPNFENDFENEKFPPEYKSAIGKIETRKVDGFHHWCTTCKNSITKEKIPKMSAQNSLQLFDLSGYEELKLTELENCLIALNIIFQKVFQLPKSRWPAMKDKTVNIPVFEADVLETVKSLPRTPSEAGIIPVNFKRKMSYKNTHKTQYVSVPKILKALATLKRLGNKYYQFIPDFHTFKERCQETDTDGFEFLFQNESMDENADNSSLQIQDIQKEKNTDEESQAENYENTEQSDGSEAEEEEYRTKDPVKKWQFEYNRSTCFSHNYPEINYKEDMSQEFSVAPGEGKLPTSLMEEMDWDIKSFPCLHPDGKNTLQSDRLIKLGEQEYFTQRILNKDTRFAENAAYIFAAIAFIENKQIQRNQGISFIRGKSKVQDDGSHTYTLDDPCSVLDNIKNTPRYWQKARYELIARLENLGVFTYFFTLSCADLRWPENFTALLQDHNIRYEYENGQDYYYVDDVPLDDFLSSNESNHAFIKSHLLNATLTFNHRVKMFIKNIVMCKGSPMPIKYYSYKVEFALRGAGHIHGVLWMDWEQLIKIEDGSCKTYQGKVTQIKAALQKIKEDEPINSEEKECLAWLADKFISCSLKNPRIKDIVKSVNVHHHTKTCRKYSCTCRFFFPRFPCLRTIIAEPVRLCSESTEEQKNILQQSKNILEKVKVILEDEEIMKEIGNINQDEIKEYMDLLHLIQKVEIILEESGKVKLGMYVHVKDEDIRRGLSEHYGKNVGIDDIIKKSIVQYHETLLIQQEQFGLENLLKDRLVALLTKAGVPGENEDEKIALYEKALSVSENGYRVLHKRDVDEIFVNNYNPEWILNWNANMDLQLCLDFFAVITYISDYYGKDDSGTMKHIKQALKQAENESLKKKLSLVSHTFLTHRQIGESEAYFRILPHLHMKESNIEAIFVATGFKKNRSRFLRKLDENEVCQCPNLIEVEGRAGYYTEKPSLIDKFMRKDFSTHKDVGEITYLQFSRRYTATKTGPKNEKDFKPEEFVMGEERLEEFSKMDFIITHDFDDETKQVKKLLPKFIKINDLQPGEPGFMKLRSTMVARLHKVNQTKSPHEFYFSELQLYRPFSNEDMLCPDSLEDCKTLYDECSVYNGVRKVLNVKRILMEHLEDVEAGTEKAQDIIDSNAGAILDPENEQDNAECEEEEVEEHPDFEVRNPDLLENMNASGRKYKRIELYADEKIRAITLQLDEEQRRVLDIGVDFAKNIVKAKNGKLPYPKAPLVTVQGGAGTGKSTVIDAMSQQIENFFENSW